MRVLMIYADRFAYKTSVKGLEGTEDIQEEKVIENARVVAKYINPSAGTTNFALMFIPDSVYLALKNETLKEISAHKIIPVNASGLLSTLFLIERQYTSIKISKVVDHLEDIKSTIENNFTIINRILDTA